MADRIALLEAATAVREAAQAHKRSANYHRKQAAELMERFGRLQALCVEHGIEVHVHEVQGVDRRSQGHEQHHVHSSS